jgi:hypothetical protein
MQSGRPLLSALAAAALMALVLIVFSSGARAKGPESATIAGPWIDQPIELVNTSKADLVRRLMEQTGLWFGGHALEELDETPTGELGPSHTLTWVNAGPPGRSVAERTIRQIIYLEADGGPVIHTPAQASLDDWGAGVIGWFAAPSDLRDTLVELAVPMSAADVARASEPVSRAALWVFAVAVLALVSGLARAMWARPRSAPMSREGDRA